MNRSLDAVIARYVGYAFVFLLAAYLLYMVRGAIPVFAVGALLAYALEPLLQRMERRGHSRRGAVGLVFLGFLLVMICVIVFIASAWDQSQSLIKRFPVYQVQLLQMVDEVKSKLDASGLPVSVKTMVAHAIEDAKTHAPDMVAQKMQGLLGWTINSAGLLLILLIILPIITLWFMVEMNPMRVRILMLVPPAYRRDVVLIATQINEILGRYVRGQMIVCSLFGVLCTIAFSILHMVYGMDYALVLGICAAFLYIIPYVGMASLATAAALTAYFTSSSPVPCALIAVGCCFAFNLTIDYGITPRIIGKGVGLHPLMVIFALMSGAQVGGIFGMVLAVPFFASLRVVAIHLFPVLAAPIPDTSPESLSATDAEVASKITAEASPPEIGAAALQAK